MAGSKKSNRREEILQALAQMLESTEGASRITTAKLAKQVGVSEAALYRHFPSKARMFEGLIEFIEEALMTRINRILDDEKDTLERIRMVMHLILVFSERNPGLTRILSGHALMFENERLRERINQLFERIETQLRQILRERKLREGKSFPVEERILAAQILGQVEGSLNRFVRSDFKYQPTANFDEYWALLSAQIK
ncbi:MULTISPECIES: nucleoid occlusion factor SlmA [Vibrio]|jgi:TetR/AcrR family transcriptional regulator|uniref:Nucleoid occlusion factor SlmA n=1 Tax=Vibrio natriegens NBRC 15636 = ATCC 14048 = DSM 759 TaxID=1219067 RepID=A0AAN1CUU3_VIBNA|nr:MULTISPECIES: nucleoid occlusion factor SlmA [Vibrio]MBR9789373.1 nucleoid occlusion factor SlmA [Vibrionaceae bacterium]MEE3878823.1 nucleoid occlusion factor SlmA [Vibrio sp. YYF0003]WMN87469.1 nucleoid occlusion factor SlmA [Vibrio parahaemolyticus]CAH0530994.1 Nucleoid occlusion factor SlmA [Catenococcus thiocycli]AEX20670.1 division inhibitor protein [Vibrio sp. EJY3]